MPPVDPFLTLILEQLRSVDSRLDVMSNALVKQEANLAEHMRRTQANEESLDLLRAEFKPVASHVVIVGAVGKGLVGLLTIGASLAGTAKALGWF